MLRIESEREREIYLIRSEKTLGRHNLRTKRQIWCTLKVERAHEIGPYYAAFKLKIRWELLTDDNYQKSYSSELVRIVESSFVQLNPRRTGSWIGNAFPEP